MKTHLLAMLLVIGLSSASHAAEIGEGCSGDPKQYTNGGEGAIAMGELGGAINYGHCGPWDVAAVPQGHLLLKNTQDEGAVKIIGYRLRGVDADMRLNVQVSIRAPVKEDEAWGAGIVFFLDPEKRTYSSVLLQSDGTLLVLGHTGSGGFTQLASSPQKDLDPQNQFIDLVVEKRRRGSSTISVNGRSVLDFSAGDLSGDAMGIIAAGKGMFLFTGWKVDPQ